MSKISDETALRNRLRDIEEKNCSNRIRNQQRLGHEWLLILIITPSGAVCQRLAG